MFYQFTSTLLIIAAAVLVISLSGILHTAEPEPGPSARVSGRSTTVLFSDTDPG